MKTLYLLDGVTKRTIGEFEYDLNNIPDSLAPLVAACGTEQTFTFQTEGGPVYTGIVVRNKEHHHA